MVEAVGERSAGGRAGNQRPHKRHAGVDLWQGVTCALDRAAAFRNDAVQKRDLDAAQIVVQAQVCEGGRVEAMELPVD